MVFYVCVLMLTEIFLWSFLHSKHGSRNDVKRCFKESTTTWRRHDVQYVDVMNLSTSTLILNVLRSIQQNKLFRDVIYVNLRLIYPVVIQTYVHIQNNNLTDTLIKQYKLMTHVQTFTPTHYTYIQSNKLIHTYT